MATFIVVVVVFVRFVCLFVLFRHDIILIYGVLGNRGDRAAPANVSRTQ